MGIQAAPQERVHSNSQLQNDQHIVHCCQLAYAIIDDAVRRQWTLGRYFLALLTAQLGFGAAALSVKVLTPPPAGAQGAVAVSIAAVHQEPSLQLVNIYTTWLLYM